ncbi:MAG: hypothetical protein M3Z05_04220 [Gemmatimonadota bacterium]|nr:hypothetical protein [Gemmatimonadota bacterium]
MPSAHEPSVADATLPERRVSGPELEQAVERAMVLAFAPLHKRVFGMAIGLTAAILLGGATTLAVLIGSLHDTGLGLLSVYFRGYDVSWQGVFIGAAWAFAVGFVAGWFLAFVRNFVLATWLLAVRVRENMSQTRDFLDHI